MVRNAVEAISAGNVERSQITKSILVIDEAQDMSADEFALVESLIKLNEDMRVIAVGDDDQNIYEFRGSDSGHMRALISKYGATVYNMTDNFRSSDEVVNIANSFVMTIRNRLKIVPINAVKQSHGKVNVTFHRSPNYEHAVVNELVADAYKGSTCVLTFTNEDALVISALLKQKGHKARLVQSREDFNLRDLAELHYFLSLVKKPGTTVISATDWERAKDDVHNKYRDSQYLEVFSNCISEFESEGRHTIYLSDFETYLNESQLETFIPGSASEIIVSTIHKAKGREYDNVYVSLKGLRQITDKERRAIYVAMTRAKNNLSIHYDNVALFGRDVLSYASCSTDDTDYGRPSRILLQLGHKDVVLSAFMNQWIPFDTIHSGSPLSVQPEGLYAEINNKPVRVVKFSSAFVNAYNSILSKGYVPASSKVRAQVFWHHEDKDVTPPKYSEHLILLPDITLDLVR